MKIFSQIILKNALNEIQGFVEIKLEGNGTFLTLKHDVKEDNLLFSVVADNRTEINSIKGEKTVFKINRLLNLDNEIFV
ncbi:MAG: hypothetical protein LBH47_00995, partial [Christensenellaceae bacterium]|nr:hypothetical protein [Christensenellaceae bacterium]